MLWGLLYKIYNLCSKKNKISTIIKPRHENILNKNNLKIVSYNIDGLFAHYIHLNYINISKYLKYLLIEENVDIICLQEVWELSILNMIKNKLLDLNLYYAQPPTTLKYCIGEHSGLLVISKYPIVYQEYLKYEQLNFTCSMTNKGLQHIKINRNNIEYDIINTHLQSSFNKCGLMYQHTAELQLNQILNYINYNKIEKCIILGDLNLNTPFMKNILKKNNDLSIKYNYDNNITFPDNNSGEQLDYFLDYNNMLCNKIIDYSVKSNIYYSDHYPIMINIYNI
tara:strand:+ start:363 stop:1208 length:846 start_codon:yes stop_codon:yes gene_type:complete